MAIMRTLGAFSNILRKSVTLLPPFALKQVTDDVQRAMLTSGVKSPTALLRMTLANFGSLAWAEIRGIQHPIVKEFGALGLTGEYDFEAGKPAISVLKDLGYRERTVAGSSLLGNLLHRLDGITRASDLAVRKAIYDQTMLENNKDQLLAQTRQKVAGLPPQTLSAGSGRSTRRRPANYGAGCLQRTAYKRVDVRIVRPSRRPSAKPRPC
jgi:hypothetical protein